MGKGNARSAAHKAARTAARMEDANVRWFACCGMLASGRPEAALALATEAGDWTMVARIRDTLDMPCLDTAHDDAGWVMAETSTFKQPVVARDAETGEPLARPGCFGFDPEFHGSHDYESFGGRPGFVPNDVKKRAARDLCPTGFRGWLGWEQPIAYVPVSSMTANAAGEPIATPRQGHDKRVVAKYGDRLARTWEARNPTREAREALILRHLSHLVAAGIDISRWTRGTPVAEHTVEDE